MQPTSGARPTRVQKLWPFLPAAIENARAARIEGTARRNGRQPRHSPVDLQQALSIFFHRGFAIHGTYELTRLGGPASHGCVRLHPSHAAQLYGLVERNGRGGTRIQITN